MIKVKHFMEAAEEDDGLRMWVEPIGLAKDLQGWCNVNHVMPHLGPPRDVWEWFDSHPDEYEAFRGQYHECLSHSHYKPALQKLACASMRENFTLLHGGDDPDHNCATALREYIVELEAYCPPEQP
ncbi:MAG TPA: DUF488 family protein [Tepidisphaeraceae bacterium]|nr:DUF488 family protein [Tepidisphaeraceae bacterium]